MLLSSVITAAEEAHSGPNVSPLVVGAVVLALLLVLLFGLLAFGKGREHS